MNCPECQSRVLDNWIACPACGERLPQRVACRSCGAEMQSGWKACPACGEWADTAGASLNITDSVVKEVDLSQRVDRSVNIGTQSGTLMIGETLNIETINVSTLGQDQWSVLLDKMDAMLVAVGIKTFSVGSETQQPTAEQLDVATVVGEKVKEAEARFGADARNADMYFRLGSVALSHEDIDDAEMYFGKAKSAAEALSDSSNGALAEVGLGKVLEFRGKTFDALNYYHRASLIYDRSGDTGATALCSVMIAQMYLKLEMPDDALKYFENALAWSKQAGSEHWIAETLENTGKLYLEKGVLLKANELFNEIIGLEDPKNSATGWYLLGTVYREGENPKDALACFNLSLTLRQENGDQASISESLEAIGDIYLDQHDWESAIESYERVVVIHRELGDHFGLYIALTFIAQAYRLKGDLRQSFEYFKTVMNVIGESGLHSFEADTKERIRALADRWNNAGQQLYGNGDKAGALRNFEAASEVENWLGESNPDTRAMIDQSTRVE